jgi:two-component system, NarL family, response regulator EvgA
MTREQLEAVLGNEPVQPHELDVLSDRELEVISLLSQGANSNSICREMQIAAEELEDLKKSIRTKCKLKNEVQLIQFAARQKSTT